MSRGSAKPGKDFWLASLRHDGTLLAAAASADALGSPVPGRPLTVGGLLGALGAEYRWVSGHVVRGVTDRPAGSLPEPPDGVAVLDWWAAAYRELLAVLDTLDPDLPAWNWAPQPKRAAFWHRRLAHLTALDRWDVQLATGTPEPLEGKAASDGVTELLDTVLPAKLADRTHEPAGVVRLVAADTGYEWLVRLRPRGLALLDVAGPGRAPVHAVAAGTASDLWLALTGRIGFTVVDCSGDERLLTQLVPET
jgi:mycothiol maleylpyruvate isomerase-like protein